MIRLLFQSCGELLQEAEYGGEAVLERGVELTPLPLIQEQEPVARHVGHGALDNVVAADQQLAVLHDLVQTLLLQVHDDLYRGQVEDDQEEPPALLGLCVVSQTPLKV